MHLRPLRALVADPRGLSQEMSQVQVALLGPTTTHPEGADTGAGKGGGMILVKWSKFAYPWFWRPRLTWDKKRGRWAMRVGYLYLVIGEEGGCA